MPVAVTLMTSLSFGPDGKRAQGRNESPCSECNVRWTGHDNVMRGFFLING